MPYSSGDERKCSNHVYAPFTTNLDSNIVICEGNSAVCFRPSKNSRFANIVHSGTQAPGILGKKPEFLQVGEVFDPKPWEVDRLLKFRVRWQSLVEFL